MPLGNTIRARHRSPSITMPACSRTVHAIPFSPRTKSLPAAPPSPPSSSPMSDHPCLAAFEAIHMIASSSTCVPDFKISESIVFHTENPAFSTPPLTRVPSMAAHERGNLANTCSPSVSVQERRVCSTPPTGRTTPSSIAGLPPLPAPAEHIISGNSFQELQTAFNSTQTATTFSGAQLIAIAAIVAHLLLRQSQTSPTASTKSYSTAQPMLSPERPAAPFENPPNLGLHPTFNKNKTPALSSRSCGVVASRAPTNVVKRASSRAPTKDKGKSTEAADRAAPNTLGGSSPPLQRHVKPRGPLKWKKLANPLPNLRNLLSARFGCSNASSVDVLLPATM